MAKAKKINELNSTKLKHGVKKQNKNKKGRKISIKLGQLPTSVFQLPTFSHETIRRISTFRHNTR